MRVLSVSFQQSVPTIRVSVQLELDQQPEKEDYSSLGEVIGAAGREAERAYIEQIGRALAKLSPEARRSVVSAIEKSAEAQSSERVQ